MAAVPSIEPASFSESWSMATSIIEGGNSPVEEPPGNQEPSCRPFQTPPRHVLKHLPCGDAQGELVDAGPLDVTGDAHQHVAGGSCPSPSP